jgi:hypothetical protein
MSRINGSNSGYQFSRFYDLTDRLGPQRAFLLGLFLGGADPESIEALTGMRIATLREVLLEALAAPPDESAWTGAQPTKRTHE